MNAISDRNGMTGITDFRSCSRTPAFANWSNDAHKNHGRRNRMAEWLATTVGAAAVATVAIVGLSEASTALASPIISPTVDLRDTPDQP